MKNLRAEPFIPGGGGVPSPGFLFQRALAALAWGLAVGVHARACGPTCCVGVGGRGRAIGRPRSEGAAGGGHKRGRRRAMSFAMLGAGCSALGPASGARSRGQGKEGGLLVPGAHPNLPGLMNKKRAQGRGRLWMLGPRCRVLAQQAGVRGGGLGGAPGPVAKKLTGS
jgi:hypothetical protein